MLAVQAAVSILFLVVLFSSVDLDKTLQVLSAVNLPLLLVSCLFCISSSIAIGFALHCAVRATGTSIPLFRSVLASFGGQLLSDVTPAKTGYFATPLLLYETGEVPMEKGLISVMAMGAVNFFVKAAFSTTALIYFLNRFPIEASMRNALIIGISLLVIGGLGLTVLVWTDLLSSLILKLCRLPLIGRLIQKLESLRKLFAQDQSALKSSAKTTALCVLASILLFAIALFLLGQSVGLTQPSFLDFLFMGPLTAVFVYVPLTFAGLGIQEAAFVFLLTLIGAHYETAFTFALLVRLIFVSTDLIGLPTVIRTSAGLIDSLSLTPELPAGEPSQVQKTKKANPGSN